MKGVPFFEERYGIYPYKPLLSTPPVAHTCLVCTGTKYGHLSGLNPYWDSIERI